MLLWIDVWQMGGVLLHEVELSRCDDSRIILERSVVSDVINAEPGPSAQELAVIVDILGFRFRLGWLASHGPFCTGACAHGHTSQCSSLFQEPPAARFSRIHDCLP